MTQKMPDESVNYQIPTSQFNLLVVYGKWIVLLLLIGVVAVLSKGAFISFTNIKNVLRQSSFLGLVALGQTFVLISGGLDLSTGSVLALSSVISASCAVAGYHPLTCLLFGVLSGITCGLINGIIIVKGRINPFIATLGTMGLFRSIAYVFTGGRNVINVPMSFGVFGRSSYLGIPSPILIWAVMFVVGILLCKSRFGWYLYATGSNRRTAFLSGVPVDKVIMKVYLLSGMFSALAGVLQASRLLTGEPSSAQYMSMDSIAAVVIGGAGLQGGEGTLSGTLFGVLILGILLNIMTLLNINLFVQQTIRGIILLIALILSIKLK